MPRARSERSESEVRTDLAAAYRLAALAGWDDTIYTHLSASVPGEPGVYLINQFGLGFDEVTASNLVKVNLRGEVIDGSGRAVNPTGFTIHGDDLANRSYRQWVGDGTEWDGDAEWPALLRRTDRLSPGFRD